jgi:hypothetical protein
MTYFHVDIIFQQYVNIDNCNDHVCIELTGLEIKIYTGKHDAMPYEYGRNTFPLCLKHIVA